MDGCTPHSPTRRSVWVLIFPGVQVLDAVGPAEIFAVAQDGRGQPAYEVRFLALQPGMVATSGPARLAAEDAQGLLQSGAAPDTLIVAGGQGTRAMAADHALIRWIGDAARRSRRTASVCTGALLLAAAGLLDGRRAATHWAFAGDLQRRFPAVRVDADALYVQDGPFWTSAGVTAGMDLALAMVRADLGHDMALSIARHLVMFMIRPGGQAQFSAHLAAQAAPAGPLGTLPAWIVENLGADLSVPALASRAGMSERSLTRAFASQLAMSPARFVERARLDAARRLLEESAMPCKQVAGRVGLGDDEALRRVFQRNLQVSPADYRARFQSPLMEGHAS
ncbi:GlxA family transcriptional regulator [Zavarzinia sp. CC-PAN008]|uniref:GlxA family transcriptional regulator n=1 Tax=Zavarzinia sp. CC-PAN008 TaxID=3243332 RepID=UPI003F74A079